MITSSWSDDFQVGILGLIVTFVWGQHEDCRAPTDSVVASLLKTTEHAL